MPLQQNQTPPVSPQSFKPYTGKAPIIIQIVGGLLYLGAAGLIIYGLLRFLINPVSGILFLLVAVLAVMTAKSLFSMKKTAFRNVVITVALIIIILAYSLISKGSFKLTNLITPALLLFVAFYYRNRFVN